MQQAHLLPLELKVKLLKKKQPKDIQLSLAGELLLIQVLKELDMPLSLDELKYNEYQRPYFNADIDFNISHSGNSVICCATTTGKVGGDIECIRPLDLNDYTEYFNNNEWGHILNADNPNNEFFKFWTRKEAVLKAEGAGFYNDLQEMDVSNEIVNYSNNTYHLFEAKIDSDYQCHIAATVKQDINVLRVIL